VTDDPSEKRKNELKAGIEYLLAQNYTMTEIVTHSQRLADAAREKGLEADVKRWEELKVMAEEMMREEELKAAEPASVHDEPYVGKHRSSRILVPAQRSESVPPAEYLQDEVSEARYERLTDNLNKMTADSKSWDGIVEECVAASDRASMRGQDETARDFGYMADMARERIEANRVLLAQSDNVVCAELEAIEGFGL
jgi:hypothetical protein